MNARGVDRRVQDTSRAAWSHGQSGQHGPGQVGIGQHWQGDVSSGAISLSQVKAALR